MSKPLLERYHVNKTLAQSAEVQTYQARDLSTEQDVVIKHLHFGHFNAWKRLELFQREARILAMIQHPRIPELLDFFVEEDHDLQAYLIYAWIPGESLAQKIEQKWMPSEAVVIGLAEQLLWILQYLHRFSPPVVHRDIKPSNLILNGKELYLIDFGGAQEKLQPMGGGGSTVIGTYGYMAPEQFAGRALPASDLYGLGACLIHLLSGRAPINLPQREMQLMFQGMVQGSGGFLRWLTQLVRPTLEDRYASVEVALQQLYVLTETSPGVPPLMPHTPRILSESLRQLLSQPIHLREDDSEIQSPYQLKPGDEIQGYTITEKLTQGTHTLSYFAQAADGREVFLKALHFQALEVWKNLSLFEREIETLKRLNHQGVPELIDSFTTEHQDYYLVQEKLPGHNLEQKLAQGWRPKESDIIEIARQALNILIYLHQQKPPVVHRDIKPSNLMMRPDGQIALIDFGGVQDYFKSQGTGGSTVIGTYGYIAPEEFLKKAVPATDLYSLGVSLIYLLSQHEPSTIPYQDLRLKFRPLVNCSAALMDWLEHMIEPDLQKRFRSAQQALSLLPEAACESDGIQPPRPMRADSQPKQLPQNSTASKPRSLNLPDYDVQISHVELQPLERPLPLKDLFQKAERMSDWTLSTSKQGLKLDLPACRLPTELGDALLNSLREQQGVFTLPPYVHKYWDNQATIPMAFSVVFFSLPIVIAMLLVEFELVSIIDYWSVVLIQFQVLFWMLLSGSGIMNYLRFRKIRKSLPVAQACLTAGLTLEFLEKKGKRGYKLRGVTTLAQKRLWIDLNCHEKDTLHFTCQRVTVFNSALPSGSDAELYILQYDHKRIVGDETGEAPRWRRAYFILRTQSEAQLLVQILQQATYKI